MIIRLGVSMNNNSEGYNISEDEKIWGFLAWLIPLIGAILALILKPSYKYAKHWAYLSISFFIVIVVTQVVTFVTSFIPFIGWLVSLLVGIGLLIVWILGIVKSLEKTWWKPPVIYDVAKYLGIES